MLWHRQTIFKSKGDTLCSSAECRIWTRGPRHQIASRLNARWQTYRAIEDQAKNLNSTARPYDQRAFSPLDPTLSWLLHLALALYILVVNFDALAQASDIQIERRQVVFLCWMQDLNPGPQTPNHQKLKLVCYSIIFLSNNCVWKSYSDINSMINFALPITNWKRQIRESVKEVGQQNYKYNATQKNATFSIANIR